MSNGPQANDANLVFRLIYDLLRNAGDPSSPLSAANALYNEGWLLRIAMELHSRGVKCLPIDFARDARWFSEPLLYSPFRARFRGDPFAERHTHADGVLGHVEMAQNSKRGLQLKPNATQFVVFEAKMYSALSTGTKNCDDYGQATRNVACMAQTLSNRQHHPDKLESLAFVVICPQECCGLHVPLIEKDVMASKITQRIGRYAETRPDEATELEKWSRLWLIPLLEKIEIRCESWEGVISRASSESSEAGTAFATFYRRCVEAGRPAKAYPVQSGVNNSKSPGATNMARPADRGVSLVLLKPEFYAKFWPNITTPTYVHYSWGPREDGRELRHYPSATGPFHQLRPRPTIAEIEPFIEREVSYSQTEREKYTDCGYWFKQIKSLNDKL